jgi:Pro-kumamolisin, activation domain
MFCELGFFAAVILASLAAVPAGFAQQGPGPRPRPRITQSVDEANRVPLRGNTRPEATLANDRGAVADDFPLEHILLQLKRSPEQEQALQQFIDELHNQNSPNFHHWLTAREFGEKFGVATSDLDTLVAWLESDGFRVNVVYPSGMVIDFSGTAAQVRKAFQTEIHHLEVHRERHVGNISDPRIPAALAPVVEGIVSLHDFRPRALHHMRTAQVNFTFTDSLGGPTTPLCPQTSQPFTISALSSAPVIPARGNPLS